LRIFYVDEINDFKEEIEDAFGKPIKYPEE